MKTSITILGFITGAYMLIDGLFVMFTGKYIGPEKPGPWANIFYKFEVDIFKLGPLFVLFGFLWCAFLYALWTNQQWMFFYGILVSVLTLWYVPLGTILSMIIIILLLFGKKNSMI